MNTGHIEITPLTDELQIAWTDFVSNHPHGLLYYSLKFRNFICEITGAQALYRVALKNGEVVGVLPVMELNGKYGRVLNSLPFFGSYGSPLCYSAEVKRALFDDWKSLIAANDVVSATIIDNPLDLNIPLEDSVVVDAEDYRTGQFTTLPISESPEADILTMIDSTARRNVQRARSLGVVVDEDPYAMNFLEMVHIENMTAIGGTAKPSKYFSSLPNCFIYGEDWRLFVARRNGLPVAAILVLYGNGVAEYFTPAITEEGRVSQATSLILLEAMTDAARRGFRLWNWGGTWLDQDGVFRFKRKWGAQEKPYRYLVNLRKQELLSLSAREIVAEYPFFYVLPFSLLLNAN